MKIAALHKLIQERFFQYGWLIFAVLPLTQLGGRALFSVTAGIYALWGLLSFWSRRKRLDRTITVLYLAMLSAFLIGIPGAVDGYGGFRLWLQVAGQSLTLLLMQVALQESPIHPDRLLNRMALFGGITLAGLYGLLPYYVLGGSGQTFDPSSQLREDNLPFLLPFILYELWRRGPSRWWCAAMISVIAASLGYIVLAEGRAALLGLTVGLAVFCWVTLGWRISQIALLMACMVVVGMTAHLGPFRKAAFDPDHPLDAFTSGRTILWRQALEHPPERRWLGVGIGNESQARQMLSFEISGEHVQVKHLHNFLLDVWYETGLLGLGTLLALISTVFGRLARVWRRLSIEDRQRAGVLLAAALAIMTASLLSFSYTSRYFACYLFACLGGLNYFATRPADVDTTPDKR